MKTSYQDRIRSISQDRDVRFLLHFTQAANLAGIVKHGLLSRVELATPGYLAYASDGFRLDDNDSAVSVSISRVNRGMFASKREKSGHANWVVLVLSAEILWTHCCLFYWRSAATREMKDIRGHRGGPWAFEKMFAGSDEARSGLAHCFPTDPKAEVQVLERIAPGYIQGAVVNRREMVTPVQTTMKEISGSLPVFVEGFESL